MAKIPKLKIDKDVAEFWDTHSLTDFDEDLELADDVEFVRPQKQIISLRLDRQDIKKLKAVARKKGIGHSTLARMWVKEKLSFL